MKKVVDFKRFSVYGFSVVEGLAMVTSSKIGPVPLSEYSKDLNI